MTNQNKYRCETCKNKEDCDEYGSQSARDLSKRCGLVCHSDFQNQRGTVWVVAESSFEGYEIKHICSSKEVALQRWAELRDELIKDNQRMVEHCIQEGYRDADDWRKRIDTLKNLKPGESCDCDDHPDLKEWELESQQSQQENH